MKRIFACILVLAGLIALAVPVQAAAPPTAEIQGVNYNDAYAWLSIDSSGTATATVGWRGTDKLYRTTVVLYYQKLVGGSWIQVDIAARDDVHTLGAYKQSFSYTFNDPMTGPGDYRLVADFTFYGDTNETTTRTAYDSY